MNAATRAKDLAWIEAHAAPGAVRDVSDEVAMLALQGPLAEAVLAAASGVETASLRPFHLRDAVPVAGVRTAVARTGYTGEDGFEITMPWEDALAVWEALLTAGRPHRLSPAGLAARETLRLEAGFMLYGQDLDETTTPLEAPLGWTVKFDKGEFIRGVRGVAAPPHRHGLCYGGDRRTRDRPRDRGARHARPGARGPAPVLQDARENRGES